MKKLMIAAAIVCAAAMSQAAQVTWSGTVSGTKAATSSEKYVVYLVDAVAGDYATAADAAKAIMADGTDAAGFLKSANGTWASKTDAVGFGVTKQALPSGYDSGDSVTYYSILFDAVAAADAKHYYSMTATALNPDATGTGIISDAGLLKAQLGTVTGGSWEATATPEPTSGLLLLLGVAGLALRRRRA